MGNVDGYNIKIAESLRQNCIGSATLISVEVIQGKLGVPIVRIRLHSQ